MFLLVPPPPQKKERLNERGAPGRDVFELFALRPTWAMQLLSLKSPYLDQSCQTRGTLPQKEEEPMGFLFGSP